MAGPDFFIIGAPKAGTTALHAALARHPDLYLSPVKEPKYFMCDGPPPRRQHRGPGDAHSRNEWIWRREQYEALFGAAPPGVPRGESTPFYLYDRRAQRRIRRDVPHARLVAILRDPVDRAYSNWMHLRSDGLEPEADFLAALRLEPHRKRTGYAPFWHYRGLGLYGEQLEHLFGLFPREQVHVLRYRDLVDRPQGALDDVCAFLGVAHLEASPPAPENVKPYVGAGARNDLLRRAVRVGASVGQLFPPDVWRKVSVPVIDALHAAGTSRPRLSERQRGQAIELFAEDVARLERIEGRPFHGWLDATDRGSFVSRATPGRPGLGDGPAPAGPTGS